MSELEELRAVVERVRAIHAFDEGYCKGCEILYHECVTARALDGAPEPEWEYADSEGEPGPHHLTRFSADLDTLSRRNENRKRPGHEPLPIYRRRKAGPWERVDGSES